jgi:hypothetical protein
MSLESRTNDRLGAVTRVAGRPIGKPPTAATVAELHDELARLYRRLHDTQRELDDERALVRRLRNVIALGKFNVRREPRSAPSKPLSGYSPRPLGLVATPTLRGGRWP